MCYGMERFGVCWQGGGFGLTVFSRVAVADGGSRAGLAEHGRTAKYDHVISR